MPAGAPHSGTAMKEAGGKVVGRDPGRLNQVAKRAPVC